MLKHYSHIRMEAKRRAVNAIARKPASDAKPSESMRIAQSDGLAAVRYS
jgi:hypothetical protein